MARITMRRSIDAPADAVWAVVADHGLYADVAPNLTSVEVVGGRGEGMVRRCVDTDGNAWTEACHRWDEGRGFGMSVDVENSDFHRRFFTRFEGEWEVSERDDGTTVTMRFDFDTKYGPLGTLVAAYLEHRARPLVERIFDGWEAAVEARLDARRGGVDAPAEKGSSG